MEQQMRYFYEIYKSGSITKAAENLYITQPALSMAIKKIEKDLGTILFYRDKAGITLSPSGQAYIDSIERILTIEKDLRREIADLNNLKTGSIVFGGTEYINTIYLPRVLCDYRKKYPQIEVILKEQNPFHNRQDVENGLIDICCSAGNFDEKTFGQVKTFKDHIVLVVPKDMEVNERLKEYQLTYEQATDLRFLLRNNRKPDAALFKDVPMIMLGKTSTLKELVTTVCGKAGFIPKEILSVEQHMTAYKLASAGIGATWISHKIIGELVPENVAYYQVDSPAMVRQFYLLTCKKRYMTSATQEFIRLFTQYFPYTEMSNT